MNLAAGRALLLSLVLIHVGIRVPTGEQVM
jgi:hypothetical protein